MTTTIVTTTTSLIENGLNGQHAMLVESLLSDDSHSETTVIQEDTGSCDIDVYHGSWNHHSGLQKEKKKRDSFRVRFKGLIQMSFNRCHRRTAAAATGDIHITKSRTMSDLCLPNVAHPTNWAVSDISSASTCVTDETLAETGRFACEEKQSGVKEWHDAGLPAPQPTTHRIPPIRKSILKTDRLPSTPMVHVPHKKRSAASLFNLQRKRSSVVRFSKTLNIHDTYTQQEYDRASDPAAACTQLTAVLAQMIKEELNQYKLHEMEVHYASRGHTHFFE
ncbi:uncharacterized protein BYT42DRAFT_149281 [Radiomyces spectabilis]|uniref:uncharacterized protein n=1 Tax=Radiomyces spectabilis TaxID=64574 RepID=UPI00221FE727|nr:uncharacterized protein BYT42DRAFT_149281 [Radiomyces spectabilis]KAI8365994.1 hypothetical protein BYT42DRAFT_149281 [Radiomyces spectabilis]